MANPQIALYELVAKPAAIAEEVAVNLVVITIHDAAQCAIPFANSSVATQPAVSADGWCHLEVPLACVVALERRIRKYTRRADFNQVAAEFVFENAVFVSPKVDRVAQMKRIQVVTTRVFAIKAHTSLALNAAVHLMAHQRAEILIAKCSFAKAVNALPVPRHHRHVLKVAFSAFVTDGTVVWMVLHQALDNSGTKGHSFRIGDGDACAVGGVGRARH